METFRYGKDIDYNHCVVIAKTPLTLTPVYRRVHSGYLSPEGFRQSWQASVAEFTRSGFVVDYFLSIA